jgi:C-terminal processing protease CtpA/Prc
MMHRSKTWRSLAILLPALALAFGTSVAQEGEAARELFDPVYEIYENVKSHFYQPELIDDREALYGAMKGIVEQLNDPYSEFLDPQDRQRFDESLEGEFSGVGIEITLVDRILTVITPLIGTPAEAAGILAGDQILAIDDESTEGIRLSEAACQIRGEIGTTVVLTVRHEDESIEEIPIVRATIVIDAVESELLEDGTIGYIRIMRFESDTTRGLDAALASFALGSAGIGADITHEHGRFTIASISEGTSAALSGLSAGDEIRTIDGVSSEDLDLDRVVALTRGDPGTTIDLAVQRSEEALEFFGIARDVEVRGLILDLRNNAGGLMDQAISVASRFVDEGIVLRTEGRLQGSRSFYTRSNALPNLPLAVLINRGTASASEITAAAIRDNQMGILIGEESFGKGVYQRIVEFEDGSALKITTGEYFTPSGAVVNGVGLSPDVSTARQTEPVELPPALRQELVALLAEQPGCEKLRAYPWHNPSPFTLTISLDVRLTAESTVGAFDAEAVSASVPVTLNCGFVPGIALPRLPERVVAEEQDPIQVAIEWIDDHAGVLMPIDLASEPTP